MVGSNQQSGVIASEQREPGDPAATLDFFAFGSQ
jgi:hypothetical protein